MGVHVDTTAQVSSSRRDSVQKYLELDVESVSSGSGSGSGTSCHTETSFVPSQTSDDRGGSGGGQVPPRTVAEVRYDQPLAPPPSLQQPEEPSPHPSYQLSSAAYDDLSQLLLAPINE